MVLWMSEWSRAAGLFYSTKNQRHQKWSDKGGKKITGVFVVRCSWHGLEFQVTGAGSRGSEARVQVVRSYKGFKGQSQGAR